MDPTTGAPMKKANESWNGVYSLTVGVAGLIIAEFLPAGVLTPMARDLDISAGMAGQAVSASAIVATFTSLFIAYFTRSLNRKWVLLSLSFLLTCSSIVVASASSFAFLIFGRVLLGVAIGGFWSMAAAITIRLVPETQAPKAIATIFGGSSFASVLAAPMGSYLGSVFGWRRVFFIAAAVGFIALVWQAFALPSLKPIAKTRLKTLIDVLMLKQFPLGLAAIALVFCGRFASFTYLRPFLEQTTGVSTAWISAILLVFGLSYFSGNAFAPGMIRRDLRKALMTPPFLLGLVGIGLLLLGTSIFATVVLVFLWGSIFGPVAPSWSTWVTRKAPVFAETAGGLYVASIQAAAAIGASLGGIAFDFKGSTGVFALSSISWFLASAIVYLKITNPNSEMPASGIRSMRDEASGWKRGYWSSWSKRERKMQ